MMKTIEELDKLSYEVIKASHPKALIINGWEYYTEDVKKGVKFTEIKTPVGWELWEVKDFEKDDFTQPVMIDKRMIGIDIRINIRIQKIEISREDFLAVH